MEYRVPRKLVRWAILLAVSTICCLAVRAEQAVTLTFRPADGLQYTEIEQVTIKEDVSAEGKTHTNTISQIMKSRTAIHKMAAGFAIITTSFAASKKIDDKAQEIDPLVKTYLDVPLTIAVSANGTALSVSGVAKVLQNTKQMIPEGEQAQYGYLCRKEGIIATVENLWREQALDAGGRTVKVGDFWTFDVQQPMPDGKPMESSLFVEVKGFETLAAHQGAHLHYIRNIDVKDVSAMETHMMQEMMRRQGMPAPRVDVEKQTEEGDVILDVHTLQPLARTITIVSQAEINMSGRILKETLQESRHYRYDYGSGPLTK